MDEKHLGGSALAVGRFILLFIAYWIFASLAQSLMMAPDIGLPIWPAAGIALAGLLVWGIRYWPAIFAASLLVELDLNLFDVAPSTALWMVLAKVVIAAGATIEAVLGAWLVRRYCNFPHSIDRYQDILAQLFYGGVLAAPVGASIGLLGYRMSGVMPSGEFLSNAAIWCFGDVLGVVLVLPPVSGWLSELRGASWRIKLTVALPPTMLLIASAATFIAVHRAEREWVNDAFHGRANAMESTLRQHLTYQAESVHALAAFMAENPDLPRSAFARIAASYLDQHAGTQAVEWIPKVYSEDRAEFEARARQNGYSDFNFRELSPEGALEIAGQREHYYPVYYVEPFEGNEAALGFDLGSSPGRKVAIDRARETRDLALSQPVTLVQETGTQIGVLMFAPVFDQESRSMKGLVLFVFRVGTLLEEAMQAFAGEDIQLRLEDPGAEFPLLADTVGGAPFEHEGRAVSYTIALGGRTWQFTCAPTHAFIKAQQSGQSLLVLVSGLLVTVMFGTIMLVVAGRHTVTQSLVDERTVELRKEISRRRRIQSERESVIKELEAALADIKTLEGLLPICASCKKIREETGDWTNIERFITQRSEADFSHSICPECMSSLYPGYKKNKGSASEPN